MLSPRTMILNENLIILHVFLLVIRIKPSRLKKFATLLQNNWLGETPQTLATRSQSWLTVGGKGANF
ncbi:hypothetical protein [Peribacillus simplex]|uniref:hypothetical protein n=1 Tax=Peribacillus simplex TaxID=1478 RepID=UPI003D27DFBE